MTEAALYGNGLAPAPSEPGRYPPVKPRWLSPAATVAVVLAHVGVAVLLMATALEQISPLDSGLNVELMPEGDTVESEDAQAMELSEAQPEEIKQADLALPPPQLMAPDAIQLPQKQETEEKKRQKQSAASSSQQQEASERRRLGVQGGHATGMSRSSYMGLLAAAIHRHVPSVSSLGPGSASCSFTVTGGGSIGGVSCSGSTGSHMALLRSAISATRPPGPPPGGGFTTSQSVRFH